MQLYKHQIETVNFLLDRPYAFITSTCGTGKTISLLETYQQGIQSYKREGKMLVIAPKSTLDAVWGNDISNYYPGLKYGVFNRKYSNDTLYIPNLLMDNDIVIINIEAGNLILQEKQILQREYSTLVIDEFTSIKNRSAKRSKTVLALSKYFIYKYLLSGTPTPNGILDIWHPSLLLDDGIRLGNNFFHFRNIVCQPIERGSYQKFVEWKEIPEAVDVIADTLRDITIRHVLEECIDMPERIYRTLEIDMPANLRAKYEELKERAILEMQLTASEITVRKVTAALKNELPDLETWPVTAVNKAVLGNKLLQIACLTGDTEILTNNGWKELLHLLPNDLLWDGDNWVNYDRILDNGYMNTIKCWGIYMTLGHEILTDQGWRKAWEIKNGESSNRFNRSNFQLPDNYQKSRIKTNGTRKQRASFMGMPMCLWNQNNSIQSKYTPQKSNAQKLWMQTWRRYKNSWSYSFPSSLQSLDKNKKSLQLSTRQRLQKLWRSRHNTLQKMVQFQKIYRRYDARFQTWFIYRTYKQLQRIFFKQLSLGYPTRTAQQYTSECNYSNPSWHYDSSSSCSQISNKTYYNLSQDQCGLDKKWEKYIVKNKVYDILNAGNKARFLIRNKKGDMFISHNSGSIYDIEHTGRLLDTHKYELITDLIKEREHSLVFYIWQHQCDELAKLLTREKITYEIINGSVSQTERTRIVKEYQQGKFQTLLLQPAAAAHGITLTRSQASIWCSPTWNLEHFVQANHRDYRIGQNKRTEVIMVQYKNTIEERVYAALQDKKQSLDNLLEILQS